MGLHQKITKRFKSQTYDYLVLMALPITVQMHGISITPIVYLLNLTMLSVPGVVLHYFVTIGLCMGMGIFAYYKNLLDLKGSVLSFFVGVIIGLVADIYWLLALIVFLIFTYGVTMIKYRAKEAMGVAQGKGGRRGWRNVVANGAMPTAVVAISPFIDLKLASFLYIVSISAAASDTFGSELGVFSNKDPFMIIPPFKRVSKGTDGAISALGIMASLLGAFIPSFFGWLFLTPLVPSLIGEPEWILMYHIYPVSPIWIFIPFTFGVLGSILDSILGATLQQRGILSNDDVNIVSVAMTMAISTVAFLLIHNAYHI